ncbi:MAG: MFS transporter [Polyangiaceae bacterium]|nr:MFS transporter [Polyangiaceae bacterium]
MVLALGAVSLLTDVASEMVYAVLPALVASLGGTAVTLGAIEGVGDATSAVAKLVSGRLADDPRRRKPLVLLGYGLATVARPLLWFASAPAHVVGFRFLDRVGKGVRSSPRDALLAASVPRARAAEAFGLHRALDNAGAAIGPLVAAWLLAHGPRVVAFASLAPGLAALVTLAALVPASSDRGAEAPALAPSSEPPASATAPSALRSYLLVLGLFAIMNTSDLFLLRRLGELGASAREVALAWSALSLLRAFAATTGGRLADRIGKATSLGAGWIVYAAAYAVLALAPDVATFLAGMCLYAGYFGLSEGAERAIVAELAPRAVLGTEFGRFHLVTGLASLPSNLLFGWAWGAVGPRACLLASAAGALCAAVALWSWTRAHRRR